MKRLFLFVVLMTLLLLGSIGLVGAQDATLEAGEPVATLVAIAPDGKVSQVVVAPAPTSSGIDWQIIFTILLSGIILVNRITDQGLQKALARMIEPEKAQLLYESGVRLGLQVALNNAARTPQKTDDDELMRQARDAGYVATLQPDGNYALVRSQQQAG